MMYSSQYDTYDSQQSNYESGSQYTTKRQDDYTNSSKKDMLINWVNSIEYPNCLLASDISDFKDGVVFCELTNEIVLKNSKPDFLPQVKNDNLTYQDSLHNLNMALAEIKSFKGIKAPSEVIELRSHELISDDDKALCLLEHLYNISKGGTQANQGYSNNQAHQANSNFGAFNYRVPANQSVPTPSKSEAISVTSNYRADTSTASNRALQKPPRASTSSNRGKNPEAQMNRHDNPALSSTENLYNISPVDSLLEKQRNNNVSYSNAASSFSQSYPQQPSMIPYEDELAQSQQQQSSHDPYYSNPNEYQTKQNYPNLYSPVALNKMASTYSEMINSNSFQNENEQLSKSARKVDMGKSGNSSYQISQTPMDNSFLNKQQVRGGSGIEAIDQYNPFSVNSRSRSPDMGMISSQMTSAIKPQVSSPKRISPSPISHKQGLNDESGLSTSISQQKTSRMKGSARDQDYSYIQKKSKSNDALSQYKKNETISSVRTTEPDKKITWESQKDEKIVVTPVPQDVKTRLLNWLYNITLIREGIPDIEKKLPKICRNGVIFIDLINRVEGKHESIKGVNRKPESNTHIVSNYQKLMNYLSKFEKMNPRYLWASKQLMEGNENIFWGLLDDIWHLYNKKISPYDSRYNNKEEERTTARMQNSFMNTSKETLRSRRSHMDVSYNDICYNDKSRLNTSITNLTSGVRARSKSPSERDGQYASKSGEYQNNSIRDKKPDARYLSNLDNSIEMLEDQLRGSRQGYSTKISEEGHNIYSQRGHSTKTKSNELKRSIIKKGDNAKFFSNSFQGYDSRDDVKSAAGFASIITIDAENEVMDWLKQMGFRALLMRERATLFEDPFRNGTLLCYVIGRLENERMHSLLKEPKTIDECRHNISQAFQVLQRKQVPLPSHLKGKEEAILKGDRNITLALLYSLMKIQETRGDVNSSAMISGEKSFRQEVSMYNLPYDDDEREQLEQSLLKWLNTLGLFHDSTSHPKSFRELTILMKSGVLLCDLTATVTNEKLITIHRKPASELQCITNIRRALEALREKKSMAQKYLWKEKDIYNGNQHTILGLLEDMHRFFDKLPPRANPNYFLEGPYIPLEEDIPPTEAKKSLYGLGEFKVGIHTNSNSSLLYPERMISHRNNEQNKKQLEVKRQESNRSKTKEQAAKLNLSADDPISIVDYEKRGSKPSVNSIGVQQASIYGWDRSQENGGLRSPEKRKYTLLEHPANPTNMNRHSESSLYNVISKSVAGEEKGATLRFDDLKQMKSELGSPRGGSDLKDWISSLGFEIQIRDIDINADVIEEFKDGLILCKIVETLEIKEIPGVILKPRTNASKMVNIRKCLNTIAKRPNLNPHLLHIEDKILAGDGETIRKLLRNIKDAYKFMNKCIPRSQSPSTSRYMDSVMSMGKSARQSNEKFQFYKPQENYVLNTKEREKAIVRGKYARE